MARIVMSIEAEDAGDLKTTLTQLGQFYTGGTLQGATERYMRSVQGVAPMPDDEPAVDEPEAGEATQAESPQPARRGRPKKDAAAAASAPTTTVPASSPEPQVGSAEPASDLAAALEQAEADPAPLVTGDAITADAVKEAMQAAMTKSTPAAVQALMVKAGIGARFSEIPAEKYADALALFASV